MSTLKQLNGHACCLLGLCCPPGSAEQRKALIEVMGEQAAEWVLANVDLIPKGSGGHSLLKAGFDMGVAHAKAKA